MPRNYINQEERETIGITKVMVEKLKEYANHNEDWMGTDEKRYLRTALTLYDKYLVELMSRVGPKIAKKIVHDFEGSKISFTTRPLKAPSVTIGTEVIESLSEGIIYGHCRVCDNPAREECPIRELFTQCGVGTLDLDAACVYYPNMKDLKVEDFF